MLWAEVSDPKVTHAGGPLWGPLWGRITNLDAIAAPGGVWRKAVSGKVKSYSAAAEASYSRRWPNKCRATCNGPAARLT